MTTAAGSLSVPVNSKFGRMFEHEPKACNIQDLRSLVLYDGAVKLCQDKGYSNPAVVAWGYHAL